MGGHPLATAGSLARQWQIPNLHTVPPLQLSFWQQPSFAAPHFVQLLAAQTYLCPPTVAQSSPFATHVSSVGSQQAAAAVHMFVAQQTSPVAPHEGASVPSRAASTGASFAAS